MRGAAATLRHELIGLSGVLERNAYLVKRYAWWELAFFVWSLANTLTIVFIAKGINAAGGKLDVDRATTTLLIGAVIWSYLGVLFEILIETVAWVSFIGIGMMTAVLPLISPEKGMQMGFITQGILLVVSGVYYPVSVLPQWMQWLSTISPATYALRGIRHAILDGAGIDTLWGDIWPLIVIGVVAIPLGLYLFAWRSPTAKRHGKLKRSG